MLFHEGTINLNVLQSCIVEHQSKIMRYDMLKAYYDGEHAINNRVMRVNDRPNNKVMVNHAEYITDFATAYFIGNPIYYHLEQNEQLKQALSKSNLAMVDTELSREISIFGIGYELIYQNKNGETISTNIDPRNAFIIVDDTVEYNTLLGVHYYDRKNEENKIIGKTVNVYTPEKQYIYFYNDQKLIYESEKEVIYGRVPIIEYWNKANQKGDFESVVGLIDAYNVLQSDRVNDKEQYVNSLLVIYGTLAGDTAEERIATAKALKKEGLLEMPMDSKAEFITKTMNESDNETLKKALETDIHKIAKVPNLTDEHFAGNSSGVALEYKLLGLEQLAQTKESYYRIGIKERLEIYASALSKRMISVNVDDIQFDFKRSLPTNDLEVSQIITNLSGKVSDQTLISRVSFVKNPQEEIERVQEQEKVMLNGSYVKDE